MTNESAIAPGNARRPYELVVGLEVHCQLATDTKIFCGCRTSFGDAPNRNTCPVCLGLPGSLPVMNRHAFELSLTTALALNCEIAPWTRWDRKQYYYPDLPKGYQISQYDLPMSEHGWLEISDPKGEFEPKLIGKHEAGQSVEFHLHPWAPVHILIVPKQHIVSMVDVGPEHAALLGHMMALSSRLMRELGVSNGYRHVINTGPDGRQEVQHLHLHVMGGPRPWALG